MKWFKKKEKIDLKPAFIGTERMYVDARVADYIDELKNNIRNLTKNVGDYCKQLSDAKYELDAIKPILSSDSYKPAISRDCVDCKYALRSEHSGDVIGCRKDNLCVDFVPLD